MLFNFLESSQSKHEKRIRELRNTECYSPCMSKQGWRVWQQKEEKRQFLHLRLGEELTSSYFVSSLLVQRREDMWWHCDSRLPCQSHPFSLRGCLVWQSTPVWWHHYNDQFSTALTWIFCFGLIGYWCICLYLGGSDMIDYSIWLVLFNT